jgi:hypothetical protein
MNLLTFPASTDFDIFPNVHKLLMIRCALPVGSVEAEISVSAPRRIKTFRRNSMGEERLVALALMHTHHNISPVRTRVGIGPPHSLVCRKRRLIGDP